MKRFFLYLIALCMLLCGCKQFQPLSPTQPETLTPAETTVATTAPVETSVPPAEETTPAPALPVGWFEENGQRYYRLEDG